MAGLILSLFAATPGWALRAGTAANKTEARNLLVEMFTRQDITGHYSINTNTDEALTTSHFQL